MKTLRVALLSEEANVGSVLQPPYSVASGSPSAVSRWRASSTRGCSSGSASLPRGNEPLVGGSGVLKLIHLLVETVQPLVGDRMGLRGPVPVLRFFQLSVLPILIASPEDIPLSLPTPTSSILTRTTGE